MPSPKPEPHGNAQLDSPVAVSRWGFVLASFVLAAWAATMGWICYRILTAS